jgi:hypothetical protein
VVAAGFAPPLSRVLPANPFVPFTPGISLNARQSLRPRQPWRPLRTGQPLGTGKPLRTGRSRAGRWVLPVRQAPEHPAHRRLPGARVLLRPAQIYFQAVMPRRFLVHVAGKRMEVEITVFARNVGGQRGTGPPRGAAARCPGTARTFDPLRVAPVVEFFSSASNTSRPFSPGVRVLPSVCRCPDDKRGMSTPWGEAGAATKSSTARGLGVAVPIPTEFWARPAVATSANASAVSQPRKESV